MQKYQKLLFSFLIIGLFTFIIPIMFSNISSSYTVKAASISTSNKTIIKGYTYTLYLKGNSQKVTWSSNNKKIVTINSKGKINTVKCGTTHVIAKVGGKKFSCKVRVENPYLSTKNLAIVKGATSTITLKRNLD